MLERRMGLLDAPAGLQVCRTAAKRVEMSRRPSASEDSAGHADCARPDEGPFPALPRRCCGFRRRSIHLPFADPNHRTLQTVVCVNWANAMVRYCSAQDNVRTRQSPHPPIPAIPRDNPCERAPWQKVHELGEKRLATVHRHLLGNLPKSARSSSPRYGSISSWRSTRLFRLPDASRRRCCSSIWLASRSIAPS